MTPGKMKTEFMQTAIERGYLYQATHPEDLDQALGQGTVPGYIGFDCTAPSLHVGSLLPIMMLRLLQKTGHKPIVVMGGGTSKIGDPSGKDESRKLLTDDDIAANMKGIQAVFARFLDFGGNAATSAIMVNNNDWLEGLGFIPFLRDVGRHFSVNEMLSMDSVKNRITREQSLSYLEFSYMICQAYDFVELYKRYGVLLQMGGSDQWGNIVSGVKIGPRMVNRDLYGLTAPLITTSSGAKMGKTAAGAVWLSPEKLSPYDYFQYWRNTEDSDVGRFLRLFTELPLPEIAKLEALKGAEINEAKKILATEATRMLHGDAEADLARKTAEETFEAGKASMNLPSVDVPEADLGNGIPVFELLVKAGLASSNGAARRLISGGGARINDEPVTDPAKVVSLADMREGIIKLSSGRKQHILIKAA